MRPILLKNIKIISPPSAWHLRQADVLVEGGKVAKISDDISSEDALCVRKSEGWCVSSGWLDLFSVLQAPGYEHKDTAKNLAASAAFGGFTQLVVMPNTSPVVQTAAAVREIRQVELEKPVRFLPVAAVSVDAQGTEMTELYDLHKAGVVAFSDGTSYLENTHLLMRVLQYLKAFSGIFINPLAVRFAKNGQMHEGAVSTALGLPGIPSVGEKIAVMRSLALLEYTGGRLHFSHLSAAESVALVRQAKKKGLAVTADVAAHQLCFTDESLADFDTNFKVLPPLREQTDREALWEGINDNTIDAIVSGHYPQDPESKQVEFDQAAFGMLGLETAFAAINSAKPKNIDTNKIVEKLTGDAAKVLQIPLPEIKEGSPANLTIFDPKMRWTFEKKHIQSKSSNTPFLGETLNGRVLGTILGNTTSWNN